MLGKAMDQEHHERITTEADKLERDVKEEREIPLDQEERDSEQEGGDKYLDAMQRLPNKRKSARRADELIRKQSLGGVEAIVGTSALLVSAEEKKAPKGIICNSILWNRDFSLVKIQLIINKFFSRTSKEACIF